MSRRVRVELHLTPLEAAGLSAIVQEGASSLLADFAAARAFVGKVPHIRAARRGVDQLRQALATIKHSHVEENKV